MTIKSEYDEPLGRLVSYQFKGFTTNHLILILSALFLLIGIGLQIYAISIMAIWSITSADPATIPMLRAGVMGQCGLLIVIPGVLLMLLWFFLRNKDKIL